MSKKTKSIEEYSCDYFSIIKDEITEDNNMTEYFFLKKRESVFVVAMNEFEKVCLIQQYRYPTDTISWELPAGGVEQGEKLLDAAKRELQEEAGLIADKWDYICEFPVASGITNNIAHIFIATDLEEVGPEHQSNEVILNSAFFSDEDILKLISAEEFIDGPSLAAMMLSIAYFNS